MKVIDNFLSQRDFVELQQVVAGKYIPWAYNDDMAKTGDSFYYFSNFSKSSDRRLLERNFYLMAPVAEKLGLKRDGQDPLVPVQNYPELYEVRSFLIPKTFFKRDMGFTSTTLDPKEGYETGLYFINTNNGYTVIEKPGMQNKEKVKSVENRMVILSKNERVSHSTCTNTKRRLFMYFNYVIGSAFPIRPHGGGVL